MWEYPCQASQKESVFFLLNDNRYKILLHQYLQNDKTLDGDKAHIFLSATNVLKHYDNHLSKSQVYYLKQYHKMKSDFQWSKHSDLGYPRYVIVLYFHSSKKRDFLNDLNQ